MTEETRGAPQSPKVKDVPLTAAFVARWEQRVASLPDELTLDQVEANLKDMVAEIVESHGRLEAQLTAAQSETARSDRVLVPREPTKEMLLAAARAFQHAVYREEDPFADWRMAYLGMLAAAEKMPTTPAGDCPLCGASPETAKHCPRTVACPMMVTTPKGTVNE